MEILPFIEVYRHDILYTAFIDWLKFLHGFITHVFQVLSNIPYGCTSVGLFIYLLKVNLVVSKLWQLLNHWASLQPLESSFKLSVKTSRTLPGSTARWRMVCSKCVFSSARMASAVNSNLCAPRSYSNIMSPVL